MKASTLLRVRRAILAESVAQDAYVQFSEAGIDWVRPSGVVPPELRAAAEDYTDCTILPGLIDAHTHLSLSADGRSYEEMDNDTDEAMLATAATNAGIHLRAGVTTVRENGARNNVGFAIRALVDAGDVEGPDVLTCGRPITKPNGHFHWCNGTAESAEEVRAVALLLLNQGADHVKLMATGGGTASSDPTKASYSTEELRAAVGAAREHGKLTTAHCRACQGIERAVSADVDCIEHAEFLGEDGEIAFNDSIAASLVMSPAFVSPTLQAFGHYRLRDLRSRKSGTSERPLGGEDAADMDRLERHLDGHLSTFRRLIDMGLLSRMVFGTDAGPHVTQFGDPAFGLQLMVDGGMAPLQAIASATRVAARALGLEDRGEIRPGMRADLLLVRGDPTVDIGAISQVAAVYKGGRGVARG